MDWLGRRIIARFVMQLKCYFKRGKGTTEKPVALNPTRIGIIPLEQQTCYVYILRNQFKTHQEYLILVFGVD
jgi:hypothetical protein